MTFVHLHRHSEFSRLDGIGTAWQYAQRASELGQPALAQTDHGTLSGALHHIKACAGKDDKGNKVFDSIKPISGVEAYFRPDRRAAKEEKNTKAWHLCLFAKSLTGWHNLLKIVSKAYSEVEDGGGFYNYPCVDWELLERYSEGIVCSTACISSWLAHLVDLGHDREVREYIARMRKIFGDDLWIEIMPHDFDDQRILNLELIKVANEFGIPLIATNDAHFPYPEWADTHRMAKIMGSQSSLEKAKADAEKGKAIYLADINPTLYIATEDEMKDWFADNHPDIPVNIVNESIGNTFEFTKTIKPFLIDKSLKLPKVTKSVAHSERILRDWIEEGMERLEWLWRSVDKIPDEEIHRRLPIYRERIKTEWKVLADKGVLDYFVMVGEIVRWCQSTDPLPPVDGPKKNIFKQTGKRTAEQGRKDNYPEHREKGFKKKKIRVGLGRGSAAGCLISFLVGIVQIDPIAYGLLFERFLNPNRKGLPDIDLDFQSDGRALVKEFISRRYGHDNVADIITHMRFQPKKVLADLTRAFDFPVPDQRKLTKPIDIRADADETTLEEILPLYPHLQEFMEAEPEIWKHALRLEGTVANAGKHAAGVIITPDPIAEYMALERGTSGDLVTSWSDAADYTVISDFGFVKIDALGIKGLQVHDYACDLIYERTGKEIDLYALRALRDPYAVDEKVMDGFREGKTVNIFQFGSPGITKLLKDTKPDNILDLASVNALYRPGPMKGGTTWDFPRAKNNVFQRKYIHPDLKEWLSETYGIIAYQEQVMQIAGGIGRLSAGDTDDMRKAMGKLYRLKGDAAKKYMAKYEQPFMDGAVIDHGWTKKEANAVWELFLEFGHYGFNKSHSCSYALQAYQDMYLKIYWPHEFYASCLTYEEEDDKIRSIVREARSQKIELVPPDVNESKANYSTDGVSITLGLTAIDGVGTATAKDLIKLRPFDDDEDFIERGVSHKPLIESGACDSFLDRRYMLSEVDYVKKSGTEKRKVWEHMKHNLKLVNPRPVPKFQSAPSNVELDELMYARFPAVSMRKSSMTDFVTDYIREHCHLGDEYAALGKKDDVVCGGEITKVEQKTASNGNPFANITVTFETDEWRCKLWQEQLERYGDMLVVGNEVMVAGTKDIWNSFESVIVQEMVTMSEFFEEDDEMEEAA